MRLDEVHLTTGENLCVGLLGGTLEASIQMPLVTWKYKVQQGKPFPTTLRGWYRGAFVNAGMIAPITGLQMGTNSVLKSLLGKRSFTNREQLFTAVGSGAISTIIVSPSNLLVIQQQKLKLGISSTLATIHRDLGLGKLLRGFNACMLRESIYAGGYLGVAPTVIMYLHENKGINMFSSTVLGSCFAGTIGAFLTHPIDTAKTCMQHDLAGEMYPNIATSMRVIASSRGYQALFDGYVPRTIRICGAVFVINSCVWGAKELKWRSMYMSGAPL